MNIKVSIILTENHSDIEIKVVLLKKITNSFVTRVCMSCAYTRPTYQVTERLQDPWSSGCIKYDKNEKWKYCIIRGQGWHSKHAYSRLSNLSLTVSMQ